MFLSTYNDRTFLKDPKRKKRVWYSELGIEFVPVVGDRLRDYYNLGMDTNLSDHHVVFDVRVPKHVTAAFRKSNPYPDSITNPLLLLQNQTVVLHKKAKDARNVALELTTPSALQDLQEQMTRYVQAVADNMVLEIQRPPRKLKQNVSRDEYLNKINTLSFEALKRYLIPASFYQDFSKRIEYTFRIVRVSMGVNQPNMQRVDANAKIGSRNVGMCVMQMIPTEVSAVYPLDSLEYSQHEGVLVPDIGVFVPLDVLVEQPVHLIVGNSFRQEIANELEDALDETEDLADYYDEYSNLVENRNADLMTQSEQQLAKQTPEYLAKLRAIKSRIKSRSKQIHNTVLSSVENPTKKKKLK
ncbi:MAG: hypothetical protein ACTSUE_26375 [Promethearchaeota archaeon]